MGMRRVALSALTSVVVAIGLLAAGAPAQAAPVGTGLPQIKGSATFGVKLVAGTGTWQGQVTGYSYQWLRAGKAIPGATDRTYRPQVADLGKRLTVRVVARDSTGSTAATSAPTAPVQRAQFSHRSKSRLEGVQRYGSTVRAGSPGWSPTPKRVRYEWIRDGRTIRGATGKRYTFKPSDVGTRIRVKVTAKRPGYTDRTLWSPRVGVVKHRVDVQRRVTYSVATRGRISTSLKTFKKQAAQTFADARGWRGGGVQFRQVRKGGSFTLWLAEAGTVPSFSSACSAEWSCRVGRNVIINQTRWKHASPAWNRAGRSLRDYRHMVVNHEIGHWLGFGHAYCGGPGQLAPVMQQQSKGTQGCRFNPWPTRAEQRRAKPVAPTAHRARPGVTSATHE